MARLTKYSNDLIRNKAVNILRKLDSENGLNGDELAIISSFCLIERVENKELKKYEDLEEQGKLLKLPCAVGDEFYCIWRNKGQNPIQKMQVKKIEIHERKGIVIQMEFVGNRGCLFRFYEDDFGKTVFLTREEAEAALKELERGKGE